MKNPIKLEQILPKNVLRLLSSTAVIITLVIIFIFLSITEFGDWQKKRQVDNEIAELTKQAADLEQKNNQISNSLSFLNSNNFKEKIAREQLNLKKEGELVYDTTPAPNLPGSQNSADTTAPESNAKKWYSYFFKNK